MFLAHEDGLDRAAFSPDGNLVVTASSYLKLWDRLIEPIGALREMA